MLKIFSYYASDFLFITANIAAAAAAMMQKAAAKLVLSPVTGMLSPESGVLPGVGVISGSVWLESASTIKQSNSA